ncbi:MAG: hypothetical protein JO276_01395 [Sphingomonadaceae bacterium]|nr:hypothetical protein [Sphingomonadaceae bacterium]
MEETTRSAVQRLATPAIEAESRAWMISCPKCGFEQSVWESGGIRYRAAGSSRQLRRCPSCGRLSWQKIYWKGGVEGAAPASAAFVVKLVLSIVLGVLLGTALILFVTFKLTGVI